MTDDLLITDAAVDALYSDHGPDHPLSVATWLRERAEQLWPTDALNDTKETK